ncbi:MAG: GNAT family N-acetyltransferase [bacterium]|nr:GNAT family N-acetyltransferase [bacterium]
MKKLNFSHQEQSLAYLSAEPEFNLFLIGDILEFGMSGKYVNTYTSDDWTGGEFPYFILEYCGNFLVYSKDLQYDTKEVASFLATQDVQNLSGKKDIVEQLLPYFPERSLKRTYMSRLDSINPDFVFSDTAVQRLDESHAEQLCDLYLSIEEFAATYKGKTREEVIQTIRLNIKANLYYGIFQDGNLLSVAATSASTPDTTMITGVATKKDFRRHGYASSVVGSLCKANFAAGRKFLCLFYSNPEAGKIYHKIGFRELGIFSMLRS